MADPIDNSNNLNQAGTPELHTSNSNPGADNSAEPFGSMDGKTFQTEGEFNAYLREVNPEAAPPLTDEEVKAAADKAKAEPPAKEEPKVEDKPKVEPDKAKTEEPPKPLTDDEIKAKLKEAGGFYADPKYEPAAIEFERTGDLSPATIKSTAEAFGVPEDMVKEFVSGQKAQRALAANTTATQQADAQRAEQAKADTVMNAVGGKEEWGKFKAWADQGGLTADQLKALGEAADVNPKVASELASAYAATWRASGDGGAPRDITQRTPAQAPKNEQAATGYASQAEQQRDIMDPRYETDEAFRQQVMARIKASNY